ncbi:hypothetical protein D9758_002394 [Tetrapyrgos nigripes]|uniref:F-box domain-containing protein n=1 Tax=Tetrapyrgos nigripes TaxID=182062 RepID=A0A8H5GP45_9AGAR|nr:hypothetical protein D9758_002394 [Tetrapyrgos nigripes]
MTYSSCQDKNQFVLRVDLEPNSNDLEQLRLGVIPTQAQAIQISQFLHDAANDLLELEARVEALRKHMDLKRSLLAPVYRLPDDILVEIFSYEFSHFPVDRTCPNRAFVSVCTRWRRVALSTPTLWATYVIDLSRMQDRYRDGLTNIMALKLYLARSKESLFSISFVDSRNSTSMGYHYTYDHFQEFLLLLVKELHRWKHLAFDNVNSQWQIPDALTRSILTAESFPQLRTFYCSSADVPKSVLAAILKGSPNLNRLKILTLPEPGSTLISANSGITQLQLWAGPCSAIDEVFKAPERCPHLESLFYLLSEVESSEVSFQPQMLYTVRDLTLEVIGNREIVNREHNLLARLMSSFTLPSLKTLTFRSLSYPAFTAYWQCDVFEGFFHRSMCSLTSLRLLSMGITDLDTVSLLQCTPTLVELEISEAPAPSKPFVTIHLLETLHSLDFQASTLIDSSEPLVPKLKSLTLHVRGPHFNDTAFVDMILSRSESRSNGIECLRSVTLRLEGRLMEGKAAYQLRSLGNMMIVTLSDGQVPSPHRHWTASWIE